MVRVMEGHGSYAVRTDTAEHEHGKKMAARWRLVLDALNELLTHAEETISDLALAAMPELDLKRMAEAEAKDWQCVLRVDRAERAYTPEER